MDGPKGKQKVTVALKKKKVEFERSILIKETDINFSTCLFLLERQKFLKSQGEIDLQLLKT